jgi:hypothetical protein
MGNGAYGMAFRDSLNGLAWGYTTSNKFLLMKTSDGGGSWSSTPPNGPRIGRNDICVVPGKNAFMSVGVDSAGSTSLTSVTYDDANTWNVIESGPASFYSAAMWWMLDAQMLDSVHGWAGSLSTSPSGTTNIGAGGMNKYHGPVLTTIGISMVSDNGIQISVFPNPTNGQFIIETNTPDKKTVDLFDINGRQVFSKSIGEKTIIDVTSLNEGIYNLTIKSNVGIKNKKLVIVH